MDVQTRGADDGSNIYIEERGFGNLAVTLTDVTNMPESSFWLAVTSSKPTVKPLFASPSTAMPLLSLPFAVTFSMMTLSECPSAPVPESVLISTPLAPLSFVTVLVIVTLTKSSPSSLDTSSGSKPARPLLLAVVLSMVIVIFASQPDEPPHAFTKKPQPFCTVRTRRACEASANDHAAT
mmetsp:Transcript_9642/g.22977  ORF Transcript_9642/g.22977 Transcript_9642/m.22977 type:complete len:180 (+) Transcript_9642:224-763(+)